MKKYLAIAAAFITVGAQAQMEGKVSSPTSIKEGKVIYQRTMRMNNMRFAPAGGGEPST